MNIYLRNRASKNFEKYLEDFLVRSETNGLPAKRLSEAEWKELNQELAKDGVKMELDERGEYYWFRKIKHTEDSLRQFASKNFAKHLENFLIKGQSDGLPADRLSKKEWEELNKILAKDGVKLVMDDRGEYYWFSKAQQNFDKAKEFHNGIENMYAPLVKMIHDKYPNFPEKDILKLLRSGQATDSDVVYRFLRYKQDGEYTGISKDEYNSAFVYALITSFNKDDLVQYAGHHHWNPNEYDKYTGSITESQYNGFLRRTGKDWAKYGRNIQMTGSQDWTWFRFCGGNVLPPVKDEKNPNGFHISLNVDVNHKLLSILDDILIKDGGQYIHAYKFPKMNFYNEIRTRHDPVTIYTNARNPELEKKIVDAVRPFVRSNDGLMGEMLGQGVSISPETSNSRGGVSVGTQISYDIVNMIINYNNNNHMGRYQTGSRDF